MPEIQFQTRAISVRGRIPAELRGDPAFCYVGRQCAGWSRSIWGNPYRVGKPPRNKRGQPSVAADFWLPTAELAVEWFEQKLAWSIHRRPSRPGGLTLIGFDLMAERLPELRGKVLGCWCDPSGPCHAKVLARLADGPAGDPR